VKLKEQGIKIVKVASINYLGAIETKDCGGTTRKKIALAGSQFKWPSNIWKVSNINRKTKTSLYKSLGLSVLFHGYVN
jgi:hypothetical protein